MHAGVGRLSLDALSTAPGGRWRARSFGGRRGVEPGVLARQFGEPRGDARIGLSRGGSAQREQGEEERADHEAGGADAANRQGGGGSAELSRGSAALESSEL